MKPKIYQKLFLFLTIIISLNSCIKSKLHETLDFAGKNRIELEKTINYYSTKKSDSLKLKAAIFLIENMITQYSYRSDFFYDFHQNVKNGDHKNNIHTIKQLLSKYRGDFSIKIYDCQIITSEYLIENIEMAFKVWKEKPWSRKIDFDTFCEFILPYKVGNEPIENWRSKVYEEYSPALDSLAKENSVYKAAFTLNNLIGKDFAFVDQLSQAPDLGYFLLSNHRMGYCKNSTDYVIYCMRAMGIPAGGDFVKHWGNRSNSHSWNFIIDENGKTWPFDGIYTNLDVEYIHREYSKKGKVYRYTYKLQTINHLKSTKELIPLFFLNRNYKDVSNQYWKTPTFIIERPANDKKEIAYLCVFNNYEWVPVQLSTIKNNKYEFKDIERGVLFVPCIYEQSEFIPFDAPVILGQDNKIHKIFPNMKETMDIILYRKYPLNPFQTNAARVVRGVFEGANNINFNNADTLGKIEIISEDKLYNNLQVISNEKYRFIRYKGGINSYGSMAELKFYSNKKLLNGTTIGKQSAAEHKIEMAFDNDNLTYYIGPKDSAWVGLDLGRPYKINEIRFAPRNDDNYIKPNNLYELYYLDKKKWLSLGKQKADETFLKYKKVPKGALLWLKNHTEGKEERIFTYNDKTIKWW